jgi:hypothetical protein
VRRHSGWCCLLYLLLHPVLALGSAGAPWTSCLLRDRYDTASQVVDVNAPCIRRACPDKGTVVDVHALTGSL